MNSDLTLECFKALGDRPHRVEWVADVVKTRRTDATTRCVRVMCAPWSKGDEGKTLRTRAATPVALRVPVAFLRYIRVGDIWQNGLLVGCTDSADVMFSELVVDESTTSIVVAGAKQLHSDGVRRHELPFDVFDAHRDHTDSYLVRIQAAHSQVLLIPVMEVVRFYFGRSGALLSKMFSGATADRELFRQADRDPKTGDVNIFMSEGLTGSAACAVTRIAFDEGAQRSIRSLVSSGIKAAVNAERYYPRLSLPFTGKTTLGACGQWLTSGPMSVFLVHSLTQCSYPFPFRNVFYHRWMIAAGQDGKERQESSRLVAEQERRTAGQQAVATLMASDLPPRVEAFPDLVGKKIRPVWHRRAADADEVTIKRA